MSRLTSYQMEELACPQCGKVHKMKKYSVINATEKPSMKEDILKNRLFQFHCEGCGLDAPLTYDCMYVDAKEKMMICLSPQVSNELIEEMQVYDKEFQGKKRIVDNVNDLKEKILIAREGLDDKVIELIKIQYVGQLKDQMQDDVLMNILFDCNDKKEFCFLVFFEKKGVGRIPLAFDYYRQTERQYADKLKLSSKDGFLRVDMEWAGNLMFLRN